MFDPNPKNVWIGSGGFVQISGVGVWVSRNSNIVQILKSIKKNGHSCIFVCVWVATTIKA